MHTGGPGGKGCRSALHARMRGPRNQTSMVASQHAWQSMWADRQEPLRCTEPPSGAAHAQHLQLQGASSQLRTMPVILGVPWPVVSARAAIRAPPMNSATLTVLHALDHLADPAQATAPLTALLAWGMLLVNRDDMSVDLAAFQEALLTFSTGRRSTEAAQQIIIGSQHLVFRV